MKKAFLFSLFLLFGMISFAQSIDELMEKAETLEKEFKEAEALKVFQQVIDKDPKNILALARASYLSSREGFRKEGDEKIRLYKQAREYARQALAIDPNNVEANYAMGVAMGRIAEISPTKEKIEASKDVKKYAEKTLKLDRNHAGAWYLLGKWHAGVKDLGATKMLLIKMIYGGMPKASYETAVACFNKAINLRPDYILYYLDLAKTYRSMGRKEDARAVLNKIVNMKAITPDDPGYIREAKELLKKL